MRRNMYRCFALLLAALLVFGGLPVGVLAGGGVEYEECKPAAEMLSPAPETGKVTSVSSVSSVETEVPLQMVPFSTLATAPQGLPDMGATLPNRRLTPTERTNWIASYQMLGNAFTFELETARLINEVRLRYGLSPVRLDETLLRAARFHSQTMAQLNTLSHNAGPYADVPGAWSGASRNVAEAFGARLRWDGGNGASGHSTPQALVSGWLRSTGHHRFLVSHEHTYIGTGSHTGGPPANRFHYLFMSDRQSDFIGTLHSVHFDLAGGSADGSTENVVRTSNQPAVIGATNVPVPTRAFHRFDGWQENGTGPFLSAAQVGASTTTNSFRTFRAVWTGISLNATGTQTFSPAVIGYGAQTARSVIVTNSGTQRTGNLSVALSGTDADSFVLSRTNLACIPADMTHVFTVVPRTGLAARTHTATVTVYGDNVYPRSFDVRFVVHPSGSTLPFGISLSTTGTLTLPSVVHGYGEQQAHNVTITNMGSLATGNLPVTLSGPDASHFRIDDVFSSRTLSTIPANGTGSFTIRPLTGLTPRTYTATVTISNANVGVHAFDISFTVGVGPDLQISLNATGTHTFPAMPEGAGVPVARSVTVTNTGAQESRPLTVTLSGLNADSFALSETYFESIPTGGTTRTFTVVPRANLAPGTHLATVTVANTQVGPHSFDVVFTVIPPPTWGISLTPTGTHTFLAVMEGYSAQTAHTRTVTNTGNQATGALSVALSGPNTDAFTLSRTAIPSLAEGATATFTVVPRTGLAPGTYTATVTVSSDHANVVPQSFQVSFTVTAAPTWGISLTPTGTHTFPAATEGYGPQAAHTRTVTNTGNQPTGPLTVSLSGDTGSFQLSTGTLPTIPASGTQTFTVVPRTGLAPGTYTATVTVSGARYDVVASFQVSFTVEPTPTWGISLNTAGTHTFPTAVQGYSMQAARTVLVTNTADFATGPLTVALSGPNETSFELSTTTLDSIPVGSTTRSFTVVPRIGLTPGLHTATVTVSSPNPELEPRSFVVSFTVLPQTWGISLDTTGTHTFPAAAEGYIELPWHPVTVANTGNQMTGTLVVQLSGTHADSFTLSRTSTPSIPAGESLVFTVTPQAGLPVGTHTATVTVSGSADIEPQSFNVSFTVTARTWGISLGTTGTHVFGAQTQGYGVQAWHSTLITNTGNQATGAITVALSGANPNRFEFDITTLESISPDAGRHLHVRPVTGLAPGTYTATVTVSGAYTEPQSFNVSFTVTPAPLFVPVTAINKTSALTVETDTPLSLGATVLPANATNRTILWGTTSPGATIQNGVLTATAPGPVTVTATIPDGTAVGRPFVATFTIIVTAPPATQPPVYPAYMFGNAQNQFLPLANINRAEVAAILVRTMIEDFKPGTLPEGMEDGFDAFHDVPAESWFYYYVAWAYNEGLVTGDRGRFLPRNPITRQELAAMLARTLDEYETEAGDMPFPDTASISSWADHFVYTVFKQGWMLGDGQGNFRPGANINRAEVATAVNRILGRVDSNAAFAAIDDVVNPENIRDFPDVAAGNWFFAAVVGATNDHYLTRDESGTITQKHIFPRPVN